MRAIGLAMTHQRHDDNAGHNSTSTVAARAAAETRVDPAHQTQSASISRKGPAVVQPRPIQAVAAAMSQFALDQDAQEEMGAAYREFGDLGASGDSPRGEEQLEIHAAQLADQLRRHQEALDQRAEQLQLQEDALGEQLQSARAWLAQRDRQLDERETSLDIRARSIAAREKESSHRPAGRSGAAGGLIAPSRKSAGSPVHEHRQEESGSPAIELEQLRQSLRRREVQMEQRLAGVRGQEAELARRSEQIERRQAEVVAAEQRIAERQHEIQLAIKRFERMGAAHERLERIDEEEAQHAARSRYLDQAEALLEQDQRELAEAQSRLEEERSQLRRELHDQRETMAAELAEAKADLGRQRARHSQRAAELDRREAAVTKLRDQLASIQRDTLEMRLTVEELWSKVSGATTPSSAPLPKRDLSLEKRRAWS